MTLQRAVIAMCAAQACAQIGAFSVAALLPTLIPEWSLTNTEAGWISGIYYAAYTLAVPLLASLTDRVDPKRIYLGSVALTAVAFAGFAWLATGFWSALAFRALMGAGWAGSYMPGLKAISDAAEGPQLSRAVAAHAAAVGVSGALSFGIAGAVNAWLGWQWALVPGALGAALAFVLVLVGLPARAPRAAAERSRSAARLPPDSSQPLGPRLLARLLRTHLGDVGAPGVGRGLPGVHRRPAHRRVDPASPRHHRQRHGPAWRLGQRVGQRAGHPVGASPVHPRNDARLGRHGRGHRLQLGVAVRRGGGARAALRDPHLVGLVVAHRGQRRQRRTRPPRRHAGGALHPWVCRRLSRPAGARRHPRPRRRGQRARLGPGLRACGRRGPCGNARLRVAAPGRPQRRPSPTASSTSRGGRS